MIIIETFTSALFNALCNSSHTLRLELMTFPQLKSMKVQLSLNFNSEPEAANYYKRIRLTIKDALRENGMIYYFS